MMLGCALSAAECYADLTGGDLSELNDSTAHTESGTAEHSSSQTEGSIGTGEAGTTTSSQEAQEGVEGARTRPIWLDAWDSTYKQIYASLYAADADE